MFLKIFGLYGLIFLGFVLQDKLKLSPKKLSRIILYFILPIFIFTKISISNIDAVDLIKPMLIFTTAILVCITCYFISAMLWGGEQ